MDTNNEEELNLTSLIDSFLLYKDKRCYINDYDLYFGELMTSALNGLQHYNPEKSSKKTYINHCIKNKFIKIHKENQEWYKWHNLEINLDNIPSKANRPSVLAATNEIIKKIKESGLFPRAAEAIILHLSYPLRTFEELGEELGVSKQGAHQLVNSAKQYLQRRYIFIDEGTM